MFGPARVIASVRILAIAMFSAIFGGDPVDQMWTWFN
jgi:hypothetical protein